MNLQSEGLHGDRKEKNLKKLESSLIDTNLCLLLFHQLYILLFNGIKPSQM